MRIIGRDRQNRPTIYISARSQTEPLRALIPQVFLAFEARVRLPGEKWNIRFNFRHQLALKLRQRRGLPRRTARQFWLLT